MNPESLKAPDLEPAVEAATPERLLDAAEELFALKGYQATSVRDITQRGGCNLAAINYHFGNKVKLYKKVLGRLLGWLREYRLAGLQRVIEQPGARLEDVLNTFARVFMEPLVEGDRGPRVIQLFLWEMLQPRLPPGMILSELVEPIVAALTSALEKHCPGLSLESRKLCTLSLVGQLAHVLQAGRLFTTADRQDSPVNNLQEVVKHIVRFTAAGIQDRALTDAEEMES